MSLAAPPEEAAEDPAADGGRSRPERRWLRWPLRIAVVAAVLVVGYAVVTFLQVWSAMRASEPPRSQAIVVLGAAQYDGRPSPALEARLIHALTLYEDGVAPLIVVTGGRREGDRFTEATTGYNWLRRRGVPDEAILKEVQGRNTWESLAAVARFLRPRHVSDVVLVSAPTHSLRLRGVGSEVGLETHVSPAPSSEPGGLRRVRSMVRETVAVGVGRLIGYRRLTNLYP